MSSARYRLDLTRYKTVGWSKNVLCLLVPTGYVSSISVERLPCELEGSAIKRPSRPFPGRKSALTFVLPAIRLGPGRP